MKTTSTTQERSAAAPGAAPRRSGQRSTAADRTLAWEGYLKEFTKQQHRAKVTASKPSPAATATTSADADPAWEQPPTGRAAPRTEEDAPIAETVDLVERIPVRALPMGEDLARNVFDDHDLLLAPAGTKITEEFLEKLRSRGVFAVRLSSRLSLTEQSPEPQRARISVSSSNGAPRGGDVEQEEPATEHPALDLDWLEEAGGSANAARSSRAPALPRLELGNLREEAELGARSYHAAVQRYSSISDEMIQGKPLNVHAADELLRDFQRMIGKDHSLGPLVMDMRSDPDDYLYHHGLNVALLSMSIALPLGFRQEEILDMALGAMFSDLGMLRVPHSIRFAPRKLTAGEWLEVNQHPTHTVNMLERAGLVSQSTMLAAFQSHERCDGSGYPRCRNQMFIHPLARVVGIADTFAAMTCLRPHRRRRVSPYQAMVTILRDRARLDRGATRAFLDCISLFPIGSYVELNDGRTARVLRSNGAEHTRPVVVPLAGDGLETDEELDLSQDTTLQIVAEMDEEDLEIQVA